MFSGKFVVYNMYIRKIPNMLLDYLCVLSVYLFAQAHK